MHLLLYGKKRKNLPNVNQGTLSNYFVRAEKVNYKKLV